MRVVCPSCAAVYDVPEPMLGARARTLRCGRCATEWTLPAPKQGAPPAAKKPPEAPVKPAPEREGPGLRPVSLMAAEPRTETVPVLAIPERERPFVRTEAPPPRRGPGNGLAWLGWGASLVLLGLLVWGAYADRGAVMHAWPPSERLYAWLGLMPAPHR